VIERMLGPALLGYTSESRWIRYARVHLGHLFGYLPGQSGDNRRLRAAAGLNHGADPAACRRHHPVG
jgi:hypothetical protein